MFDRADWLYIGDFDLYFERGDVHAAKSGTVGAYAATLLGGGGGSCCWEGRGGHDAGGVFGYTRGFASGKWVDVLCGGVLCGGVRRGV